MTALDEYQSRAVHGQISRGEIDMTDCRLITWHGLPVEDLHKVFPDVVYLGEMDVEFESKEMAIYRYADAVGNTAFAFDKGYGLTSHGSQILTSKTVSDLRSMGAQVG
jgi:hypothetical protein